MRVVVANTLAPLTLGGGELHGQRLVEALRDAGHQSELVQLPFVPSPPATLARSLLAWRLVDLEESDGVVTDRLIALRFPSYLARHPRKVVWLIHQHRGAYDLWGHPLGDLSGTESGLRRREMIRAADRQALAESTRVFANSRTVAARLSRFNGIDAEPLYHPPPDAGRLRPGRFDRYVFAPSRLEALKRQDLLIDAMARIRTPGVRCLIAGTGAFEPELRRRIGERALEDRVTLLGQVSAEEMLDLYANAGAVYFGPYDEDLGYVTLEAFLCAKPVVTLRDSGGPLEFVEDGVTGLVADPEPDSVAARLDALFGDPALAARLGRAAQERYRAMGISWSNVLAKLLG